MEAGTNAAPEGAVVTNNTGTVHAQRDAWIGNSFQADLQNFNLTANLADLPPGDTPEQRRSVALNILYYEGFNAKRDHLSRQVTSVESFEWIENTEWPEWLSRSDDKPCWISGLPGSGKSTLMKYLSENRRTKERLPTKGKMWHIVYFFFDYRGGSGLQNNIKGLLQLFLGQLVSHIPSIADSLGHILKDLEGLSVSTCTDALCQVLAEKSLSLCAFVDGLDEYQGDSWDFNSIIQSLRDRASVKFCFASRPDTALTSMFNRMSVINIVVHHHNLSAIQACVSFKIEALQLKHYHLADYISDTLCEELVQRAEGVILWASLVIDEIFKELLACEDPSSVDLEQILGSVPAGLDALYDRILSKISPQMGSGAALFLYLLREYEASVATIFKVPWEDSARRGLSNDCPLDILSQAWLFIRHICHGSPIPSSEQTHERRAIAIRAFIGDLVDIYTIPEEFAHYSLQGPRVRNYCVRLIHKSLSSAIAKNFWLKKHLDSDVERLFPNRSWRRLGLYMMAYIPKLSKRIKDELEAFPDPFSQDLFSFDDEYSPISNTVFGQTTVGGRSLQPYKSLFVYCAKHFPFLYDKRTSKSPATNDILCFPHAPKNSSVLHFVYCNTCVDAYSQGTRPFRDRVLRLYNSGYLDLYCTLMHSDVGTLIAKLSLYQPNTRRSLVSDLFDITVFRTTYNMMIGPSPNSRSCREFFAHIGARFKPTHLCGMEYLLKGRDSYDSLYCPDIGYEGEEQTKIHDTACALQSEQPSVAHHWLHIPGGYTANSGFLALLISSGLDVDRCFREEGSIFHAILEQTVKHFEQAVRPEESNHIPHFSCKFLVAAKHFVPPVNEPTTELASRFANRLHEEWRILTTHGEQENWKVLQFLDLAREALEEAEKTGEWGPKLDLFERCYVVRDDTPLKEIYM